MGLASFFGADWTVAQNGNLRFVARHPILSDLATIFASYDLGKLADKKASIYVGVHSFTKRILPPGFRIGVQTEQFFDANGRSLWGEQSRARILRQAWQYDVLLDLSPLNRPAYAFLPGFLRRRLRFGPHIYPSQLPRFQPGEVGAPLLFFGAINPRRKRVLDAMGASVRVLPYGIYGDALTAEIAMAKGVLNLHFADGVYTEYPRLLTALMHGKALWSETLAPPLIAGLHYLPLAQAKAGDGSDAYAACASDFVRGHQLRDFLATVLTR
jgi:hypothetical protein